MRATTARRTLKVLVLLALSACSSSKDSAPPTTDAKPTASTVSSADASLPRVTETTQAARDNATPTSITDLVPQIEERDPETGDVLDAPPLLPPEKQALVVDAVSAGADCRAVSSEPVPSPGGEDVIQVGRIVDDCLVFSLEHVPVDDLDRRLDELRSEPDVVAADVATTPLISAGPVVEVGDPERSRLWWLDDVEVEVLDALEVDRTAAPIRIAVIDTGIDDTHPDLRGVVVGRAPWSSGLGGSDGAWHGTHVAGIAAAIADNGVHGRGVARNVELLDVPFGPSPAAMITWAVDHGAQVINMSWCEAERTQLGGVQCTAKWNTATAAAVLYAREHDVVLFAAAGNCGPSAGARKEQCGFELNRTEYPSGYPGVIGVGAYDRTGAVAGFSTRALHVDLSAPGVAIVSTLPGDRVGSADGTSMASPMAAGAAAALMGHRSDLDPGTITALLLGVTRDGGDRGWDTAYGSGRIWPVEAARRLPAPAPQPPSAAAAPFPLHEGQEGQAELTERLQTGLSVAGYYVGRPDGRFGPRTRAAVEALQADHGFGVTGQVDEALLEFVARLAERAPACDAPALISVAAPLEAGWVWDETPSCHPGWALLGRWLPDTAASGWSLFRVRGDRWQEVSQWKSREPGIWLGRGTQLGERGFAELWGTQGWPYRVSSADEVASFLFEGVFASSDSLPGASELAAMWLSGDSLQTWNEWLYLSDREQGELQPCGPAEDLGDSWTHCFLMRPSVGYPYLLRVSPALDAATFELYAFD